MKAYYLVFVFTLLLSVILQAKTDKQWRWKLFWTFLPLFIYAAIRVDYGNDYPSYEELFNHIHSVDSFQLDSDLHAELGYQLLNKIMPSYRSILVLNSLLLSLALGVFCYHNIPNKYLWLAVVLIFLNPEKNIFGNLVGIRNGLVVTSFILAFSLVQKRKWLRFAILTAGLSFIHTSALLFLPVAYVAGFDAPFRKKEIWLWGGMILFLFVFSLSQVSEILGVIVENDIFARYERYLEDNNLRRGLLISIVNIVNVVFIIMYFLQRGKDLKNEENSLLRVGLLYTVMYFLGSLAMRSSYFYDMFYIGTVITIFSDKRANPIVRYGLLALALVTSYYSMFHVWMGVEWWNHGTYHSLLGDW